MVSSVLEHLSPLLAPAFVLWASPVSTLELLAFGTSLAMVVGNLRVKVWAWPMAIIASACYALLFAASHLYGQAGLQGVFIVLAGWGWWQWLRGTDAHGSRLNITRLSPRQRGLAALATLAAWPVLALLLARNTDSMLPVADALPTVASVTGQILLARKKLDNWVVWLMVNVFSVGLFAWQGLWLTAVLYVIFAVLSWVGLQAWRAQAARHV